MVKINDLIELRRFLHQHPELSGEENETAITIRNFINKFQPDGIIQNIGGHGLAITYKGKTSGKTILFRCELDALPIQETNQFSYKSTKKGISHKCGHDGHMAILAGLAKDLSSNRPVKGNIILLFQPAEETGEGAKNVLADSLFSTLKPDYVFALHNVPGYPLGSILCKKGAITPAVKSMAIKLFGKTSHAAEPEKGINPAIAISKIITIANKLENTNKSSSKFCLITPIHINLGEEAYGVSAGYGEIRFTIRCWNNKKMTQIIERFTNEIEQITITENIKIEKQFLQEFHSNINNSNCTKLIKAAADSISYKYIELDSPFKWGEDFGLFTEKYKGALMGLGAGENHPSLHNPDYDFPDELITNGIETLQAIKREILES